MSGECDRCSEHALDCKCIPMYKSIESLIEILEKIKENGYGSMSFPKALYLLTKEIQEMKNRLERLELNHK